MGVQRGGDQDTRVGPYEKIHMGRVKNRINEINKALKSLRFSIGTNAA